MKKVAPCPLILILLRELERDIGLEKFNGKISRRSVVRKSLIAKMCSRSLKCHRGPKS